MNIMKKIIPMCAFFLLIMAGCGEKADCVEETVEYEFVESFELDSDSVALLYPEIYEFSNVH